MKKHLTSIILVLIFFIGLSVLLYPTISDYWNSRTQSKAIQDYESALASMNQNDFSKLFAQADKYNKDLSEINYPFVNHMQVPGYNDLLNISGNGIIGYITIEKINVELPIYHGTSESVLNVAVGHLEGSSLPIGGESRHAVLSAHRGLPSAKLFTNLDELQEGDTFNIKVLDRVLTYEVDQIRIVKPNELDELNIKEGKDYCTLVTCTPYGINTHRILVRGERIETDKASVFVNAEAFEIDPLIVTPVVAAPMLLVLLIVLLVKHRKKKS